jgi:NRAMP (natural resistance-associated macrophage protein)-like metal ion transporter
MASQKKSKKAIKEKSLLKQLGPGLITGAADDDPSGIATYSQTGAQYGTGLLWLAAWTLPLMGMIQEMCGRIALVTGQGLGSNIKKVFSKKALLFCTILLFIANILNIGADLGAIAKGIQLILPASSYVFLIVAVGVISLLLQVYIPYKKYAQVLKWLVITLFSYIATGFIIHMDWGALIHDGLIPHIEFTKTQILLITAILGTTISPYLFFWETSQEVEEQISEGLTTVDSRQGTTKADIKKMRIDVWAGMILSNLVMFFIVSVCANTLFKHGINNISTASDAAQALVPFAGPWAKYLFAIGIIGTGMLAIPILAGSTSYAIAEAFGWKEGLYRKLSQAKAFYGVISIAITIGILINFIGVDQIKALIYSAIANGIAAPFILIFIVLISGSKKVMGEHKNSTFTSVMGWIIVFLMAVTAVAAVVAIF